MELDKEIETPFGVVRFKGTVNEEQLDHIIKVGLLALMARGEINATFVDAEEYQEELDNSGPKDGDTIQ